MRVMAQVAMVMNLDKCIGCHTCSVTCKQTWTNRRGMEYAWFNNVETRPGQGYPRRWQDQDRWRGGWRLNRRGGLTLRAGSRVARLANIFASPVLPGIKDYYEPWTYDYQNLVNAPLGEDYPVAEARSLLTGKPMKIEWSANWDDDLGGSVEHAGADPVEAATREAVTRKAATREAEIREQAGPVADVAEKVRTAFEQTFMFYLPRICEHCLNPACVASCPSGALYKREEDGIVLVDQDHCRGWRQCVTACPYKKMYFNHRTGKAEKCTFCYPRIEVGLPTVCSETCVGRLRYLGVVLYDADAVTAAASVPDEQDLYGAQLGVFLDPEDPRVRRAAERDGVADDWIEAARRSPVHALVSRYRVALPLHPEYRTMPMVWYIPPLSPVVEALTGTGHDGEDAGNLFGAIDALHIPVEYLAGLFTAGDPAPVRASLEKLAAMRAHMRAVNLGEAEAGAPSEAAGAVGMSGREIEEMYRLLAIAKYEERYVIPTAAMGEARRLEESALPQECSLDHEGGPGMGGTGGAGGGPTGAGGGAGPFGEDSGRRRLPLVSLENLHGLRRRQTSDDEGQR
ncbi:putative nitrate reductase beta chain [Actinacidiphila reveromycinica]|uniref:Putative nitrate reductase beta chain n=1 Tax=Actinacidiphila reveromycinica TaxID=659352 RepID=A0A7U3UU33_9ACTN|nr:nitrate reductase subunit beta [Streptomyces sp. SN-593]BBA98656.1 putative nitrate reductase beta chain [Streptomyces sp. SN-593]